MRNKAIARPYEVWYHTDKKRILYTKYAMISVCEHCTTELLSQGGDTMNTFTFNTTTVLSLGLIVGVTILVSFF